MYMLMYNSNWNLRVCLRGTTDLRIWYQRYI